MTRLEYRPTPTPDYVPLGFKRGCDLRPLFEQTYHHDPSDTR
jgi:hypothetical protein